MFDELERVARKPGYTTILPTGQSLTVKEDYLEPAIINLATQVMSGEISLDVAAGDLTYVMLEVSFMYKRSLSVFSDAKKKLQAYIDFRNDLED